MVRAGMPPKKKRQATLFERQEQGVVLPDSTDETSASENPGSTEDTPIALPCDEVLSPALCCCCCCIPGRCHPIVSCSYSRTLCPCRCCFGRLDDSTVLLCSATCLTYAHSQDWAFTTAPGWLGASAATCAVEISKPDHNNFFIPASARMGPNGTYMWRIGRLIRRGQHTFWKCLRSKGDKICGFEAHCSPGNTSNVKAKHPGCFAGEPVSDAMIAQGTSAGGGWFGINQVTARRLLKLKILFVLVCVFNFLSCNMAHSDIFKQWTYEMEPNFTAPHRLMFGRIVVCIYSYLKDKIQKRLTAVLEMYNHPFACGSLDHWTSKHSKMGFAAVDIQFTGPDTGH